LLNFWIRVIVILSVISRSSYLLPGMSINSRLQVSGLSTNSSVTGYKTHCVTMSTLTWPRQDDVVRHVITILRVIRLVLTYELVSLLGPVLIFAILSFDIYVGSYSIFRLLRLQTNTRSCTLGFVDQFQQKQ